MDAGINAPALWTAGGFALVTASLFARKPIMLALRNPHQALTLATNANHPWLLRAASGAFEDAKRAQFELFGAGDRIDDSVDAFRHAYGAGLLHLRATREHGMSPDAATRLVRRVGDAHERDGADNPSPLSALMDQRNNDAGIDLALARTEPTFAAASAALRDDALAAMDAGRLVRVGGAGPFGTPAFATHALVPTVAARRQP